MHHQYPTYYEIEKSHREDDLQRKLEQKYWADQIKQKPTKKRPPRWRTFISMLMGFFF